MSHTALSVANPGIMGCAQTPSTIPHPTSTAAARRQARRHGTPHLPDVTWARMAQRQEEPRAEVTRKSTACDRSDGPATTGVVPRPSTDPGALNVCRPRSAPPAGEGNPTRRDSRPCGSPGNDVEIRPGYRLPAA